MVPAPPTSFVRLWFQLTAGLLCLAAVSWILSLLTDSLFRNVFPCVLLAAVFYVGLALWWVTLWARRLESKLGQYTIGSFFFLTVFLAGFCSLVCWVATSERNGFGTATLTVGQFMAAAFWCLLFVAVAIPILLRMAESVIWLGVWLLRRKRDR